MNMNGDKTENNGHVQDPTIRRYNLPVIHVVGSYYDIGYDVGKTFKNLIHISVNTSPVLNDVFIPLYNKAKGREVYDKYLEAVQNTYPQYVRELEGVAEGADVPFYKLFLLHLDDIFPTVIENKNVNEGQGCSTVILNENDDVVIGHNEDAYKEILNNVYVMHARVTEVEPNEVFTSYCYAGLLPGYAMGYNHYLAFSINIIGAKNLGFAKIPRTFVGRALLSAKCLEEVEQILRYNGGGLADAMSVNLAVLQKNAKPILYNIEASPSYPASNESAYGATLIKPGHSYFHCNKLLHLKNVPEVQGPLVESSDVRHAIKDQIPDPKNIPEVINILGTAESKRYYNIFRDNRPVITIGVGIFNFMAKTWSVYVDNPKTHSPVAVFPLYDVP